MAVKFHIKPDGTVAKCTATKRPCPYGGDENHFPSKEAAEKAFQDRMESEHRGNAAEQKKTKKSFSKEDFKQAMQDKLVILTAQLEQGVSELKDSEKYKKYLNQMASIPNYSANNIMLIMIQTGGNATTVNSAKRWKEDFKRYPKKGSSALRVFAPIKGKYKTEARDDKGQIVLDNNGDPVLIEKEYSSYKLVPVFDVSQTEGEPLVEVAVELEGNAKNYKKMFNGLKKVSPVPIEVEPIAGGANGYYNHKKIGIREGMSQQQTLKTTIHEVAHARLHDQENKDKKSREQRELEAESVAYVVSNHFGIDSSEYSFGYLAIWGKDTNQLKETMETVRNESYKIIQELEKQFK
jgi:hypothetical protein